MIFVTPNLDSSPNKEIHEDRFHLGLSTFEVIPSDQTVPLNSQVDKSCQHIAAQQIHALMSTRITGIRLVLVQGGQEVLHGVIEAYDHVAVPLGVGSPQHHHLIHIVCLLELPTTQGFKPSNLNSPHPTQPERSISSCKADLMSLTIC